MLLKAGSGTAEPLGALGSGLSGIGTAEVAWLVADRGRGVGPFKVSSARGLGISPGSLLAELS